MSEIEKAIDAAFAAQIKEIYKALSRALVEADTAGETDLAKERFRKALAHSERTRTIAKEVAGT